MGEAKRKRASGGESLSLIQAVERVSMAIRKVFSASSEHHGFDCYTHAGMAQILLGEMGFSTRLVCGYAAWRVGEGDGDVISHTQREQSYVPDGVQGLPYHAWLEYDGRVIDFSTYCLRQKAAQMDRFDGGTTTVDWCPDYLVLHWSKISSYEDTAQLTAGTCHYERSAELTEMLAAAARPPDPESLEILRFVMKAPADLVVSGPNTLG